MARNAKIVIIEEDPGTRALIRQTASSLHNIEVIAETDSQIYGYELVRQNRPEMVFVDIRGNVAKSMELVERISTYFKDALIVVSGNELTLESILAAMQAGAREYLRRPLQAEDIAQVIEKHKKDMLVDDGGDSNGRILTVFSNKGGLGKTTISVNLAIALSEVVKKPVALVDLNLQLGDITTFLDIMPKQTIVDIAKNIARVDAAYLESSLSEYRHKDAHVYILADPLQVEDAEEISAEQINTVLTILKSTFQYVIVDTNTSFDAKTLTALDLADNILLVSMVNLPTIRSTQRVLSLFERLQYDEQKVKLLMNRYIPDEEITLEDVEDTLEHKIYWKIPNNYNVVMTSINRGSPIATMENGAGMYQNFVELACKVSGVVPHALGNGHHPGANVQKESKGLLGGLFGKK